MKRFAAIALLLLFTSNASAALLAEFSLADSNSGRRTGYISRSVAGRAPVVRMPFGKTTTSDLNRTFTAPPDIVDVFNTRWTTGNGPWTLVRSDVFDDVHKWQSPLTNKFGLACRAAVDWLLRPRLEGCSLRAHVGPRCFRGL